MPKISPDQYAFVEKPGFNFVAIRLQREPYTGVIVSFSRVGFKKPRAMDEDDGTRVVHFDYEVWENPNKQDVGMSNSEFVNLLGDIIVDILEDTFEKSSEQYETVKDNQGLQVIKKDA